ncbi:MAG: acyltransferase [Bdellovibrionales bacterium]|jgi:peptidoglycan/LPS O-acetylase OafA/YrhL
MGFLRLFLALGVIAAHTSGSPSFFVGGRESVLLFYIISGFYMSLILNEKYTGVGSNIAFYKSRYLRLWVPYAVAMVFVAIGFLASGVWRFYAETYQAFPAGYAVFAGLSNIFILGQDILWLVSTRAGELVLRPMGAEGFNGASLAMNGPVFSVSLELYFYMLAPFIVRRKRTAYLFALTGLAYHVMLRAGHLSSLGLTYHVFPATVAYFGMGASLYHLSKKELWQKSDLAFIAVAVGLIMLMSSTFLPRPLLIGFMVALPFLFALMRRIAFDRWLGELSYGVYIIHLPLLMIVNKWTHDFWGVGQFWGIALTSILLSMALHHGIEVPLTRYRERHFASRMISK